MPHLIKHPDETVTVLEIYTPDTTVDAEIAKHMTVNDWQIVDTVEVAQQQIPTDQISREFRNAWRHCKVKGVRICMETAKDIHRQTIRREREAYFAKTDVLLRDAIHLRRDASAVVAHAQELRDATRDPAIDAANSVEELKAVRPAVFAKEVPVLGERLAPGEAPQYDTKALENWANALNDKIARLEAANSGGLQRDLQLIMGKVDEISTSQANRIEALQNQLDFVTERAAGKAELTMDEVQQ